MDILLCTAAVLLTLLGIAGCILPLLPGPLIGLDGMACLAASSGSGVTGGALLAWLAATLGATAADYFLPAWVTRLLGGSRAGQTGATVGMLAGMLFFMSVASLILGPFLGAVAGELLHDRRDPVRAVRIGLGSFVSFAVGTGVKLAVCIAMFACTLAEIYPAISEWFSGLW